VAQFHSARAIPSINPVGTPSTLMPACNEEPAGAHFLLFDADLEYDGKHSSGSMSQYSETVALSFLGSSTWLR
jgi:hypothetical protein